MPQKFNDVNRFKVLSVIVAFAVIALFSRLFYLQIVRGEEYYEKTKNRISATFIEEAPRGEILDRYGKPMVTNRVGYSLKLQKSELAGKKLNGMLFEILTILEESGYPYKDSLPISDYPFEFAFTDSNSNGSIEDEKEAWFATKKRLTADMSASEIIEYYCKNTYSIGEEYSPQEARKIIGIRYDISLSGFSATSPFTIAEDIDINVITKIKERKADFEGVYVTKVYYRSYNNGTLAAHILGGIGKIGPEEYAELKDQGYGYNDLIGTRGVEKLYERYLRGENGITSQEANIENVEAVPGDYLVLTLDSDLQKATEESLAYWINEIASAGGLPEEQKGGDANAGAAVVLDVKNGDVLASATYPTYDPASFNKDYNSLIANPANPIWNRAISGGYAPGSTFKPIVAVAALETGSVTAAEEIECTGIYNFYEDYQPKCWIWSDSQKTHGMLDVTRAIEFSCNCFFYEAGRRTGIDAINKYAKMFGLGELTGIGFSEEAKGNVSNPEYKEKVEKNKEDKRWYPADTIITAIGQSYSQFTPIQLANYVATIANGGTLYKTQIVKAIRSSKDGSVVYNTEPTVLGKVDVSAENLQAVKQGMYGVVDEGSASSIFADYPISVGGKTGTAQVGNKVSNNALFVAFAPFENPEIAVAVVLEHGVKGANAAYVAKDIFDEYFSAETEIGIIGIEGELLP